MVEGWGLGTSSLGNLNAAPDLHAIINQDSWLYITELNKDQKEVLAREGWKCSNILHELSKFSGESKKNPKQALWSYLVMTVRWADYRTVFWDLNEEKVLNTIRHDCLQPSELFIQSCPLFVFCGVIFQSLDSAVAETDRLMPQAN